MTHIDIFINMQVQELHTASILIEVKGKASNIITFLLNHILYGSSQLRHNTIVWILRALRFEKFDGEKKVSQSTFLQHLQTCT